MYGMEDKSWYNLINWIKNGRCTPFIGAGMCADLIPTSKFIAKVWAEKFKYPFVDNINLEEVAQYISVQYDRLLPKAEIVEIVKKAQLPDFSDYESPYTIMSLLPFSIYFTTNYDNIMFLALEYQGKSPHKELCKWNKHIPTQTSIFENNISFSPSPKNPIIFHFHGNIDIPESIVISKDDYLDFIANMVINREYSLFPHHILRALSANSILFLGYSLQDWNFLVLLRTLYKGFTARNIIVLPLFKGIKRGTQEEKVAEYFYKYYANQNINIYMGTVKEFCTELWDHWEHLK